MSAQDWQANTACAELPEDLAEHTFFPTTKGTPNMHHAYDDARALCQGCPVAQQCLEHAMSFETSGVRRWGMFGGLTPSQHHALAMEKAA